MLASNKNAKFLFHLRLIKAIAAHRNNMRVLKELLTPILTMESYYSLLNLRIYTCLSLCSVVLLLENK